MPVGVRRGHNDAARAVLELECEDEADIAGHSCQADPSLRLLTIDALGRALRVGRLVQPDLAHASSSEERRAPGDDKRVLLVGKTCDGVSSELTGATRGADP